jgi:transcription elongation GreA/GreB family factor
LSNLPELAAAGDIEALENEWLDSLPSGISAGDAAEVFSALSARGKDELAGQLLEVALDEMGARGAAIPTDFLEASAPHFDVSPRLRSLVVEMLRDEYLMYEPLERFLRLSGLTEDGKSLRQSWAAMQRLLQYREGAWILHETMGPGRVVRITRDGAVVDFDGSPAYGLKLDALLDGSRPIPLESPAVARRLRPDEFRRMMDDPASFLVALMKDSEGKLTRQEVTAIAGQKDAAELWKKLTEAAEKNPATVPSGESIDLRGSGTPEELIQAILSSKDPLVHRNREVARVLRQLDSGLRRGVAKSVLEHLPRLRSPESGSVFELHWMLLGEPASTPFPEVLGQFVEKNAGRAVRALGEISGAGCRKVYLEGFLRASPDEELKEFLDSLPRNLWLAASDAARREKPDAFRGYLDGLLGNRSDPDLHLRAVELVLTEDLPEPAGFDVTSSILETMHWARAEQSRRAIQALLNNRMETFQAYLRSLDSRRLGILAESTAEVGAAQDTGLVLEILREVSSRRSGTGEKVYFWQCEYLFDSSEAIDRRRIALQKMRAEDVPAAARAIAEAASHGDLSENAEYKAALERRDLLLDAINRGLKQLDRLRPYPARDLSDRICSPGTRVILEPADGTAPLELSLVGPLEADPEGGRVNYLAPLGAALLGCEPGDEVDIQGDERKFAVASISILPEAAEPES